MSGILPVECLFYFFPGQEEGGDSYKYSLRVSSEVHVCVGHSQKSVPRGRGGKGDEEPTLNIEIKHHIQPL